MPKILVIDDDKLFVEPLIEWLRSPRMSCTVDLATTEKSAYEKLKTEGYDIIIADIMISGAEIRPGVSFGEDYENAKLAGVRICQHIRKQNTNNRESVIIIYTVLEEDFRTELHPYTDMYFSKGKDTKAFRLALIDETDKIRKAQQGER